MVPRCQRPVRRVLLCLASTAILAAALLPGPGASAAQVPRPGRAFRSLSLIYPGSQVMSVDYQTSAAPALPREAVASAMAPDGRARHGTTTTIGLSRSGDGIRLNAATPIATGPAAGASPTPIVTHYSLAAAWPMAGHDPGQSFADVLGSVVPGAVPLLHLRWQAQGLVPQIEAGGLLYAINANSQVESLDAAGGTVGRTYQSPGVVGLAYQAPYLYVNRSSEIRIVDAATAGWSNSATDSVGDATPTFSSLIVSGRQIFTGSGPASPTSLASFYSFDAQSGNKLWQHPGSFTSTPCLAYGTLYVSYGPFGSMDTYVIDAANGFQFREFKKLGAIQWNAAGDRVYASVLSGPPDRLRASVRAYDRFGKPRWVAHNILFGAALPEMMFGIAPGGVDARSALDGHRLWRTDLPGLNAISSGTVAVSGDLIVVQADDGVLRLLDRDTGLLVRTLKPPFVATLARNLLVGGGIIFESVTPVHPGGKAGPATLLAFGP